MGGGGGGAGRKAHQRFSALNKCQSCSNNNNKQARTVSISMLYTAGVIMSLLPYPCITT